MDAHSATSGQGIDPMASDTPRKTRTRKSKRDLAKWDKDLILAVLKVRIHRFSSPYLYLFISLSLLITIYFFISFLFDTALLRMRS